MLYNTIEKKILKTLETLDTGSVAVTLPSGQTHHFEGHHKGLHAELVFTEKKALIDTALKGDVGFAQHYFDGTIQTSDLNASLLLAMTNYEALRGIIGGNPFLARLENLKYFFKRNTKQGSRSNIHFHYDLGNDFYKEWLDPTMTYSSALFTNTDDLQTAQLNKYGRILDRLDTRDKSILEIGCGWGGFAEEAVKKGHTLKGLTLSTEQHDYARTRLAPHGEATSIVLQDYRDEKSSYDHVVSIEMFEAVGEEFWPTYFKQVAACLKHKGTAIIQTITIRDDHFAHYRKTGDVIRSMIFPGGMLPSKSIFKQQAQQAGLRVVDEFDFGHDYSRTLLEWQSRFNAKKSVIEQLGFDERFSRIWNFYLASCIAGFSSNHTDVVQMHLEKA